MIKDKIKYSRLSFRDWEKYKDIRLRTIKNESDAFPNIYEKLLKYTQKEWENILDDPDTVFYISQIDSKPVGVIRVTFNDEEVDPDTSYIGGLYVDNEYRGMGIATKLLDLVTEESKNRADIIRMKLWVRDTQKNAISLYNKLGFKKVGESIDTSEDGNTKYLEIIMEKKL